MQELKRTAPCVGSTFKRTGRVCCDLDKFDITWLIMSIITVTEMIPRPGTRFFLIATMNWPIQHSHGQYSQVLAEL